MTIYIIKEESFFVPSITNSWLNFVLDKENNPMDFYFFGEVGDLHEGWGIECLKFQL